MPPTDPETSFRNARIIAQLTNWASVRGPGIVTESSGGFLLPDGSRLSPDAAWISLERRHLRPTCPEFVIELLSPSDRPAKINAKMLDWIANGAELGWMIDPRTRTVTIFRAGQEPEVRTAIDRIADEGPVEDFVLNLEPVWNPV